MSLNWNNIRPLNNSQNEGFEELVCQLAKKEKIENKQKFIRKGIPDAGVECFWILENNNEWAWQAKFFTNSLTSNQWGQLDKSVKTALDKHPNLKKYYIAMPNDPPDARIEDQSSMLDKWGERVEKWKKWATEKGKDVEFLAWWSSDLIERLQQPDNVGLTYFWFNKEEFTNQWCIEQTELAIDDLGKRYTPELNLELDIAKVFDGVSRNHKYQEHISNLFDEMLIKGSKVVSSTAKLKNGARQIEEQLSAIYQLFANIEFRGNSILPSNEFVSTLDNLSEITNHAIDYYKEGERELAKKPGNDDEYYRKHGHQINLLYKFDNSIYEGERANVVR